MAFDGLKSIHQKLIDQVCNIEDELAILVTKSAHTPWEAHRQVLQALVRDLGREKPQIRQFYGKPDWEIQVKEKFSRNIESMLSQLEAKGTRDQFVPIPTTLKSIERDVLAALEPIDDDDWEVL